MKQLMTIILLISMTTIVQAQDRFGTSRYRSHIKLVNKTKFYRYGSTTIQVNVPGIDPQRFEVVPKVKEGSEIYFIKDKIKVVALEGHQVVFDIYLKNKNTLQLSFLDQHSFPITENPSYDPQWQYLPPGTYLDLNTSDANTAFYHSRKYFLKNSLVPHIELANMEGKKVQLEDFKGQVVLLNFWFIGCSVCMLEMPAMVDLGKKYDGFGVKFLSMVKNDDAAIRNAIENYPIMSVLQKTPGSGEPIFETLHSIDTNLEDRFNLMGYPTTMIIDKKGVIRYISLSYVKGNEDLYAQKIEELLKEH